MKYTIEDIAVVILNWNGKNLLKKFLPSIISCSKNAKIYVADNASSDDSIRFVTENYSEIIIIKNNKNGGYAKGYNDALKHVKEPILCLLNSDIEVTQGWLLPILETYNSDTDIAIIQPKILDYNQKTHFEYAGAAGGFIDKYAYPFCRGRIFNTIEKDVSQYDDKQPIFWASGACFFIIRTVFNELNGFDENYFAHMEEIDLCWRAFNKKYKTWYVGVSKVYHVGGATLNNTNPKKTYLNFRNSLFTLVKNTDRNVFGRVVFRMALDGIAAVKFLITLKPLYFFAIVKAHAHFYLNIFKLLKQRKSIVQHPDYEKTNSIVFDYFIKRKKTFDCL